MDIIGIAGLLVSIAGFALSLWQLARTRRAAEAALAASIDTARAIRMVHALTDIEQICGRSRDLLHLTRGVNISEAATAAFELRNDVAKFHATLQGRALATPASWRTLLEQIGHIHDELERAAVEKWLDDDPRTALLIEISHIHIRLSTFAAIAVDSGANHANPN